MHAQDELTFNACLHDMAETCDGQAAVNYLAAIDKTMGAMKFLPTQRYGHLALNVARLLNNMLRADRELPTVELFDAILS